MSSHCAHLQTHARRPDRAAFTLVELMAVVTLIAIFVGVIGFAFLRGNSGTVGLQSAQTSLSSLLTLVRSQAAISGRNAGLFVNVDVNNPERYLRFLVPAVRNETNQWVPIDAGVALPPGCYVVPPTVPSLPWIESGASWTNLNSTALAGSVSVALVSRDPEAWRFVEYFPRGVIGSSGRIVLATARANPSGTDPLFVFTNPDAVRGVALMNSGLVRLVGDRAGFQ